MGSFYRFYWKLYLSVLSIYLSSNRSIYLSFLLAIYVFFYLQEPRLAGTWVWPPACFPAREMTLSSTISGRVSFRGLYFPTPFFNDIFPPSTAQIGGNDIIFLPEVLNIFLNFPLYYFLHFPFISLLFLFSQKNFPRFFSPKTSYWYLCVNGLCQRLFKVGRPIIENKNTDIYVYKYLAY